MKAILLNNGQTVLLRVACKEDAPKVVAYIDQIAGESDFLTFGPGEFSLSINEEEALIEQCSTAGNKIMILALAGHKVVGSLNFRGGARPRIKHAGEFGVSVLKEYWNQ